jgi:hypothetical protein
MNIIYLIQTSTVFPNLLKCLKDKDHVLLSYKENTKDTTIFFPNSTWTTGRNKIREYVLSLNKTYDYYIFLDEDIKFSEYSQINGFNKFEQLLEEYKPYIANPNLVGYYPNIPNCNIRTTVWYDGIYNAFSKEAFFSDTIFPYVYAFDKNSWWFSQFIMIMLCSLYKKNVILFTNIKITNILHSNYPRGLEERETVQKYVLNNLIKNNNNDINLNWDHTNFKIISYNNYIDKKCIIITTINSPTKQILHYADIQDWDLIIVGDSKTNDELYKDVKCIYLGLKEQQKLFPSIYEKIPLKSYTRKMFGYLYAIKNKYTTIYDTDDDNKYTETLNSYENNFKIHKNIDFPGHDIKCVIISGFNAIEINREMKKIKSICASSFTFDVRDNRLYLKDNTLGVSFNATPHNYCFSGIFREIKTSNTQGFVNLYKNYTDANIWPRGIPPKHSSIDIVPKLSDELPIVNGKELEVSIIQGLVNNDPDVDAYYRININNKPLIFEKDPGYDIVLNKNSVCPFNTQNTFWTDPSMFYAMYLPVTVTFRYTDILHGFVALYQLWKNNKTIKFTFPTAFQERNEHDLQKDYESEVSMYETAEQVISLLEQNKDATIQEVYSILADNNIVDKSELDVLNEWMKLVTAEY